MSQTITLNRWTSRWTYRHAILALSEAAVLATIFVLAWQQSWPVNLPGFDEAGLPFGHYLPAVRLVELFAIAAIGTYTLAGWPGRHRLRQGPRLLFTLALAALFALAALSPLWAAHRGLAAVHAGHMLVWVLFALMMASGDWSIPRLVGAFLGGLLVHAAVGYLQMGLQHFVGLGPRFGELPVRPQDNWASVVFAGPVRLLRAYGLSSHPNVLGGHASIGVILSFGLLRVWPRVWRALIAIAWAMVWALLLITFSRSAWAALAAGGLSAAALLWRGRHLDRRAVIAALTLATIGAVVAAVFVRWFGPFLIGRVNASTQPFEQFSMDERRGMIDVAVRLIVAHPLTGVGAANFSTASQTLLGYPLDWVHNVPLLITSELGLPGALAFATIVGSMAWIGRRRWRSRSLTMWQTLTGGGLVALLTIMLFDHYLWTAPQGTLLWALLAGLWMAGDVEPRGFADRVSLVWQ